jgi:lipopolysaccharide assembly protein A
MRILSWLLRAFIFFTLFAFALNNLHSVNVHWFFGVEWRAQMVFVVLAAFSAGCAVGVLSMLPGWWLQRSKANKLSSVLPSGAGSSVAPASHDSPANQSKPTVDGHPPMLGV